MQVTVELHERRRKDAGPIKWGELTEEFVLISCKIKEESENQHLAEGSGTTRHRG